jgi:hypothetical protein
MGIVVPVRNFSKIVDRVCQSYYNSSSPCPGVLIAGAKSCIPNFPITGRVYYEKRVVCGEVKLGGKYQ